MMTEDFKQRLQRLAKDIEWLEANWPHDDERFDDLWPFFDEASTAVYYIQSELRDAAAEDE